MRCPSVCLSRSYILLKRIKISSKKFQRWVATPFWCFRTKRYGNLWQYSDGKFPNGDVSCRLGRQKSRFWANIWLHCILWTIPVASAIHLAATHHGEFITLVAGKRPSLLMAGNNDEGMTRSLNVTPKTTEQHLIVRGDKFVAYV